MTLKQFAEDQGISYEAVRRAVKRHGDKLNGHIIENDGVRYLDEEAVKILRERRRESPIVVQTMDQGEEIRELTAQIESLRAQLMQAQNELLSSKDRIIALQDELKAGIEDRAKYQLLLTDNEEQKRKLRDAEADLDQEREMRQYLQRKNEEQGKQIEELRKEADSYQKSFFGFYRKRGV
jgi:predicted  nucleic acid-binding Zn-ribbon protein